MGKYPLTQTQYEALMGTNPSRFGDNPNHPLEQISWFDAQTFCEKLSQLTGQSYRLSTFPFYPFTRIFKTNTVRMS